jgi:hypothetical protein
LAFVSKPATAAIYHRGRQAATFLEMMNVVCDIELLYESCFSDEAVFHDSGQVNGLNIHAVGRSESLCHGVLI